MTRHNTSSMIAFDTNNSSAHGAQTKTDWSFSWEFDWSPAAVANARSLRDAQRRMGGDELGHMLDKALAYAG